MSSEAARGVGAFEEFCGSQSSVVTAPEENLTRAMDLLPRDRQSVISPILFGAHQLLQSPVQVSNPWVRIRWLPLSCPFLHGNGEVGQMAISGFDYLHP